MQVLDFAKYLLTLKPESNAARLALYHYFKNGLAGNGPFRISQVNRFMAKALTFSHWRAERGALSTEVRSLVENFVENNSLKDQFTKLDTEIQAVEVEHITDLYEIVKTYWGTKLYEGERLRVLPDQENGCVAIRLQPNGSLIICYHDKWVTFRSGKVEPLCDDLQIKYNSQLELAPQFVHSLQIQPGTYASFAVEGNLIHGRTVRGYTFTRLEEISGEALNKKPNLFYPLKRMERFFINRATDPLYIELTRLLDQAIVLLRENHPESVSLGSAALERGQNALELIFTDDKLLPVLLRELSTLLLERAQIRRENEHRPPQ